MNAAALFSGGKDSLYSVLLAERQGVKVPHLLTLLPSLPWPSPHSENIEALKKLAKSMKKSHSIVNFQKKEALINTLRQLEIDALIAGDIQVEAHVKGLKDVCGKVGLDLIEPIYRRNTSELFREIFDSDFKAIITGVNLKYLAETWLGFIISRESGPDFLSKIGKVDPLGENGEFHTLVVECPLFDRSFSIKSIIMKKDRNMAYLNVTIK